MTTDVYTDMLAREIPNGLVTVEREDTHAVVTMRDPGRLNVLSAELTRAVKSELTELVRDRELRTVVLTGEDPGFSAGGDFRIMQEATRYLDDGGPQGATDLWRWIRNEFGGVARLIRNTDKAFIAALNGPAAGVGLAFAFACDMVVASDRAVIVPAFGRIGLLPEVGTSHHLTRRLGYQKAFEFYVSGRHIEAEEALALGLVNAVVPHGELTAEVREWCQRIGSLPGHAVEMTKPLLRGAADMTWDQALLAEEFAEPSCFTTAAFRDAVSSMLR